VDESKNGREFGIKGSCTERDEKVHMTGHELFHAKTVHVIHIRNAFLSKSVIQYLTRYFKYNYIISKIYKIYAI